MRDFIVFVVVLGSIPFIFKRPAYGIMMFTWLSLMNPHRLTYGPAYDFPFAAVIGGVTIFSLLITKESKKLPVTPVTVLLMTLMAYTTLTSFFALEPLLVWREWNRVNKTLLITVLACMALNTEKDTKWFTWVVALSLGLFGLKGGIFSVMTGGNHRVFGPDGSYIAENNALALALLTTIPLIWFLRSQVSNKFLSYGLLVVAICTAIATMGSYSRGGLLGGAVMLVFLWLKGGQKVRNGLLMLFMVGAIGLLMPDQWFERMDTIKDYKADASSLGRINAWYFAVNLANDNLLGGGFNVFSKRMFWQYAPDPLDYHVAHSIYFQVLGEQGYIGLTLFLLLMFFAWRTGSRVIKQCATIPEQKWAADLAKACQVAIIGYATGGAFLSLAWFDLYYDIIIILVLLEKQFLKKAPAGFSTLAPSPHKVTPAKQGERTASSTVKQ